MTKLILFNLVSILVLVFQTVQCNSFDQSLDIKTDKGTIRGITERSTTGKKVDSWYGIPFAKPPVNDLRFQKPVPPNRWAGVLNTKRKPNSCMQTIDTFFGNFSGSNEWNANTKLSEDCLYLNVAVPHHRPKNCAVLFFIYGGGYYSGTSTLDLYDLKTIASEEDIIMVSINYRVGSLGFLSLGIEGASGNLGLFDQNLALKWVHNNIKQFGGDPNRITLFGQSAGGASVGFHLISPLSRNLFHRGILSSGTSINSFSYTTNKEAVKRALLLAKAVQCPYDKNDLLAILTCLRTIDAKILVQNDFSSFPLKFVDFPFVPVVDGEFLVNSPRNSIAKGDVKQTEILLGSVPNELLPTILYSFPTIFPKKENVIVTKDQFQEAVHLMFDSYLDPTTLQHFIDKYTYYIVSEDNNSYGDALIQMSSDYFLTCGINDFGESFAKRGNDVYMYYFTHRSENSPWPEWTGAMHRDELSYVFGQPLNPIIEGFTSDEKRLSRTIMKYWANFARNGDPNEHTSSPRWPKYTVGGKRYLQLDTTRSIGRGPREETCDFMYLLKYV